MSRVKKVAVILVAIFIAMLVIGFSVGSIANLIFTPSEAIHSDKIIEDIGGDGFLTATLKGCLKVHEEKIQDGSFKTSSGKFDYFDAKNITYVDTDGKKDYLIVWKTTPDKYPNFKDKTENQYISAYLTDIDAKCFIEYSYEHDCVYGIIIGTGNISYSEYDLMYDILNLNRTGFDLVYTDLETGGGYYSSGSHYHTVVPDRYTLSRTDPGAYYDHYEYGDNYDIDNYLESEGYD